jgi:hypothetical protein
VASPAGGVSLDIDPPAPVELEEPALPGVPADPAALAPELGELVDPELLAAPVLEDEPL